MRIFGDWNTHIAYPYKLVTGPAALVISLAEVKAFLKLDASDTSEDSFLTMLIEAVTDFAEKYTRRDFINKTYITYRNSFQAVGELRRSKLQSISFIKYYDSNDTLTTVSSAIYAFTDEVDYSQVYVLPNQSWPSTGISGRKQNIQIQFVAGYGASSSSVPSILREALLQHVAYMYENRGDCTTETVGCDCSAGLPSGSRMVYNIYKIKDISGGARW